MQGITRWGMFGVWCIALIPPVLAEAPYSFDSTPGRLPKNVVPDAYRITITPDPDTLTIRGTESIELHFRSATDTLVLNSVNEVLRDVRLDGRLVRSVDSDSASQFTTLKLNAPQPAGPHELTFSYSGKIETQPRGLFLQNYTLRDGRKGTLLSTQMEAADARRMFPCWDEPAFRATYQLSVNLPSKWQAVSNMPVATKHGGARTTIVFRTSPRMPSYLVALTAGDLVKLGVAFRGVQLGIWTVRGEEKYGATALANAKRILADYDDYFGYPYPLPKLDSVAIPGGFAGAMENWGAISYNDQALLVTPNSTVGDLQEVFNVQAHEMAHQWSGDLVTMGWWDDLWLNESFASWMAARETARRHPEWNWWDREDASKERAMNADATASSHPIQQHVVNELDATNAFDPAITYYKGQSILRMFEAYIGADAFRAGVRGYIAARAFSNATTADLWNSLNLAANTNIGAVAAGWTEQPGFPLVTVRATCDAAGGRTVGLVQSRFLPQGADSDRTRWGIPLQVRIGVAGQPRPVLLVEESQTMQAGRCGEPLSLNAGALGFYRVRYDRETLELNTKSFAALPPGDRIALLDDQWALVGAGKEALPTYLALAGSMGNDHNVRAWEQLEHALSVIEYDERGATGHDVFSAYARSLIKPALIELGRGDGEAVDVSRLRRELFEDLGRWGDLATITDARERFDAFLRNPATLTPDEQVAVLEVVARNADPVTFEKLHAMARGAHDDVQIRRYYSALMLVRDESLAKQAAQILLSPEIPPQADNMRLLLIGRLAETHQELAWRMFCDHQEMLLGPYSPFGPYIITQFVPQTFWSGVSLAELETWIRAHVPAEMGANIDRGMESARHKLAEKELLVPAADLYLRSDISVSGS